MQNQLQKELLGPKYFACLTPVKDVLQAIHQVQIAKQLLQNHDSTERGKLVRFKSQDGTTRGFTIRLFSAKLH
jgi:hypothetical protein